ncbi:MULTISPECIES: hypothetical protein [Anaerolinea]|uniref:Uncharacterized protein n=1 Tax=Anaerolinea thermophila (strain DSM 14523 / JCM 11388 / NBRC 100420 / UNI-1) TaxID=926569 RepID=E8N4G5_ANATU|nr:MULTISPECIES: hypothetical protein [Anaerolinea]BAJ63329.1 hypothetical protein ANT_12950 [Anaerolinea thermophila UNI-1]
MKDLGLAGWCAIGFLLLVIIGFNLWLYEFFKSKGDIPEIQILKRSFQALQKPFGQEEEQISELARKVREINSSSKKE